MSSTNFFELFELAVTFDIDSTNLRKRYLKLQALSHPDLFINASDEEKRAATRFNSDLNRAYNCLKNPVTRAGYMQSLHSKLDIETQLNLDASFLQEQLEWRERLEEVTDREALQPFQEQIAIRLNEVQYQFSQHYQQQQYEASQKDLEAMMFVDKMLQEIKAKRQLLAEISRADGPS